MRAPTAPALPGVSTEVGKAATGRSTSVPNGAERVNGLAETCEEVS